MAPSNETMEDDNMRWYQLNRRRRLLRWLELF